jgi:hypothetical protein
MVRSNGNDEKIKVGKAKKRKANNVEQERTYASSCVGRVRHGLRP